MQSRRLIPALLPPADPAGAKPRRDRRFLDRVSRHEVPKTTGKKTSVKIYDPARVSHIPVSQSVLHPSVVAGSFAMPDPDPSAGNVQRRNRWISNKMSPAPLNDHRGSEGLYCKGQKPKHEDSEKIVHYRSRLALSSQEPMPLTSVRFLKEPFSKTNKLPLPSSFISLPVRSVM